jgi:glycosyltransferase involved in cell wall biosynthesis
MPWHYRFKLARLAARRSGWLRRQRAELWVSTPWLQHKYAAWQPRLVPPTVLPASNDTCRVFYHGSKSHAAETRWLKPVMAAALQRDARLSFEIVGGTDVYRLYRDLPRVSVVHPMKWPAYQAFLAMPGRHVGLVPLLDLPFNQARACTKFFDITRCGAVGIYSPGCACDEVVRHESEGLVVPLEQTAWADAILRLAGDSGLRQKLLLNAQSRQREWARCASEDETGRL